LARPSSAVRFSDAIEIINPVIRDWVDGFPDDPRTEIGLSTGMARSDDRTFSIFKKWTPIGERRFSSSKEPTTYLAYAFQIPGQRGWISTAA